MPIPLYIKNTPLDEQQLRKRYQTIFADTPPGCISGSAAAPTAPLHFTNRLFKKLEGRGIKKYFVTLHIGLGTFAPINEENFLQKKLHMEYYEIDNKVYRFIDKSIQEGKKLVAVGTTTVRALESFTIQINRKTEDRLSECQIDEIIRRSDFRNSVFSHQIYLKTDLFIFPPYRFQMVDCLITNFHLPKSSLMMLVEAFLQYKKSKKHLIDLYKIAINNKFRFYSFGDVMIVI